MGFRRYVLKRALQAVPTVIAVVTIAFFMIRFIPGDPVEIMMGYTSDQQVIESLQRRYGLDQPLWRQYLEFLFGYLTLDFGTSIRTGRAVESMIMARLPHTILLATGGMVVALLIGIPAGIVAAVNRDELTDDGVMVGALLGVSTPDFWIGLILILVFAAQLGVFPATGAGSLDNPVELLHHLVLPAITLGTFTASLVARLTRSSMIEVLEQDYIQAARARGIGERTVIYKHGFRNASIPVITVVGLFFGNAIAGTIVIEEVFARPGVGRLLLDSIFGRDYPVVQGTVVVIAVMYIIVNLITDLVYTGVDPKITYDNT